MKNHFVCPHCQVLVSQSLIESKLSLCRNDECAAVYVVDNKGNVITDSLVD